MSDTTKQWLRDMYRREIFNSLADLNNERIWAAGSSNESEAEMHTENAECLSEYVSELEKLYYSV